MKVICRQKSLSGEQRTALGFSLNQAGVGYELTVGQEYTVLGISFQSQSVWNKGAIALLRDDIGRCASVPMCLLEVSDARLSRYWLASKKGEFDISLWPKEFEEEYFLDDLSDGESSVVQIFDQVSRLLDEEHPPH